MRTIDTKGNMEQFHHKMHICIVQTFPFSLHHSPQLLPLQHIPITTQEPKRNHRNITSHLNMWVYKRYIFSCKHYVLGDITRPCVLEMDYNDGLTNKTCDMRYANQLTSYNVEMMCSKCQKKRQATDSTMSKLKLTLQDLNQTLSRIKEDGPKLAPLSLKEVMELVEAEDEDEMENEKREMSTLC